VGLAQHIAAGAVAKTGETFIPIYFAVGVAIFATAVVGEVLHQRESEHLLPKLVACVVIITAAAVLVINQWLQA